MQSIKHTIKRDEIYYFNLRLTDFSHYRRSLKTDSARKCSTYVDTIIQYINRLKLVDDKVEKKDIDLFIDQLISNKVNEVHRLGTVITNPLSNAARGYFNYWYTCTDTERYNQYNYDNCGFGNGKRPEIEPYRDWLSKELKRTSASIDRHFYKYDVDQDAMVLDEDCYLYDIYQFPTVEGARLNHLNGLIDAHINNMTQANEENNPIQFRKELQELEKRFASMLPIKPPALQTIIEEEKSTSLTFNEAMVEYLKTDPPPSTKRHLEPFTIELGDIPLDEITLEMIITCWNILILLPKRNGKKGCIYKYKGLPIEERWEAAKDSEVILPVEVLYSSEEIKKIKKTLTNFFDWITDIKRLLVKSPVITKYLVKAEDRKTIRTQFPLNIADKIITHCRKNLDNPYSWIILLMAFHGLRTSEAVNLTQQDIIIDPTSQVRYLYIRKGKTLSAQRKVPLHKELHRLGFLDIVDNLKNKEDRLFGFEPARLSTYYLKLRDELNLPNSAEDGNSLSLYSFRHNVVTQLERLESNGYTKCLIGHVDITSNYTHLNQGKDYLELQRIINTINYVDH